MYDFIIKGGFLIDPYLEIEEEYDLAFKNGKVAKIDKEIDKRDGEKVFDAEGNLITPGWVDLHTHLYWGVSHYGVEADPACLEKGVTTAVDAGSSGALNLRGFKKFVIEKSRTRILAFLHISRVGLTLGDGVGELLDFRNLDFKEAVEVGRKNSEVVIGIKIRLNENIVGGLGPQALILAKEAAKRLKLPLMVHPGSLPKNLPPSEVLSILDKGDIFTHCYPPPFPPLLEHPSIFSNKMDIAEDVLDAADRGVVFDVGHGRGSFSFSTAERALEQGFRPTTISTDLHAHNIDYPVYDMSTTLSKFMNMGLSLREVIEMATLNPSSAIGMTEQIGTLKEGAEGDAVIMRIEKGEFNFWDSVNNSRKGEERIKIIAVLKKGKPIR